MASRAEHSSGEHRGAFTEVDNRVTRARLDPEPLPVRPVLGVGDVGLVRAAGGAGPELEAAEPVEEDGDAAEVGVGGGLDLGRVVWGRGVAAGWAVGQADLGAGGFGEAVQGWGRLGWEVEGGEEGGEEGEAGGVGVVDEGGEEGLGGGDGGGVVLGEDGRVEDLVFGDVEKFGGVGGVGAVGDGLAFVLVPKDGAWLIRVLCLLFFW